MCLANLLQNYTRCVSDKADKALASLKRLERSSDMLNDILVYCVSRKLDPATRAWKLRFNDDSSSATYSDLSILYQARRMRLRLKNLSLLNLLS